MFNNSNGYSLADIAAATGGNNRNDGMWDNGAWWIIILFLFCFNGGMWGNGFGRGMGGQGAGSPAFQGTTTRAAMFSYETNLTVEQEELLADLIATYGQEIISKTNDIFQRLKANKGDLSS